MADLTKDHQFDLDGYLFGFGTELFTDEDGFDPGSATWRAQDAAVAQGDGVQFGRDFRTPPTWAWSLGVDRTSEATALATLGAASKAWGFEGRRLTPGAVATLRYRLAGRVRRVYGRPGRFVPAADNRIMQGYMAVTADFRCADHLTYSDAEQSVVVVQGGTSSQGGIVAPLREPIRTTRTMASSRGGNVNVTTVAPTWALVTIKGPISQPRLALEGGWEVGLDMVLSSSDSVVIDPRPWARTAILNGTASVGGKISRKSRLSSMLLPPGPAQFVFTGAASQAGATATVSWRDAHYGL